MNSHKYNNYLDLDYVFPLEIFIKIIEFHHINIIYILYPHTFLQYYFLTERKHHPKYSFSSHFSKLISSILAVGIIFIYK